MNEPTYANVWDVVSLIGTLAFFVPWWVTAVLVSAVLFLRWLGVGRRVR